MSKKNALRTVTKKALHDAATQAHQRVQLFARVINALMANGDERVMLSAETLEKAKGVNVQFMHVDGGLELTRVEAKGK